MENDRIFVHSQPAEDAFLHKRTKEVDLSKFPEDIKTLLQRMRHAMRKANGVGLSANQIGLPYRLFVAEVPSYPDGKMKFYAIFNPTIEKYSEETEFLEEGCLSVPGTYGEVERSLEVVLKGQDKNGKAVKIRAWGLLAHVFQHEIDHLDGKLFIEKARNIQNVPASERLKKREAKKED